MDESKVTNSQRIVSQPSGYDNQGAELSTERNPEMPNDQLHPTLAAQFASLAAPNVAPQIAAPPPGIGYQYSQYTAPGQPALSGQNVYFGTNGVVQYNNGYLGQPPLIGMQPVSPQHYAPGMEGVAVVGSPAQYGITNGSTPGMVSQGMPINGQYGIAQMPALGNGGSIVPVVGPQGATSATYAAPAIQNTAPVDASNGFQLQQLFAAFKSRPLLLAAFGMFHLCSLILAAKSLQKYRMRVCTVTAAVSTAIGNLLFGPAALTLAFLGYRQSNELRSRQLLIASIGIGSAGIVIAIAGWGVLGSFLARKVYLEGKYCSALQSLYGQQFSIFNFKINYCYATSWNTLVLSYSSSYNNCYYSYSCTTVSVNY